MIFRTVAAVAALAVGAFAQTHTDCNPLDKTDCPVDPAIGMSNWTWTPSKGALNNKLWNNTGYVGVSTSDSSLNFTMAQTGQAPTIQTMGYFFYGTVSVIAKIAAGQGIISAITCLSDDLDEIDFEFKGGITNAVFSNFYGKYNNTGPQGGMTGGGGETLNVTFDPTADFHNYTIVWTKDTLQWMVDGNIMRTLKSSDPVANNGTRSLFPQTPMRLMVGNWAGGDSPSQGTVDWAGGKTDWSKAPFTMQVKSVYVSDDQNGSPTAQTYTYGDESGLASSIKIAGTGQSVFAQAAAAQASSGSSSGSSADNSSPSDEPSLADKTKNAYNGLSSGAKIGIAAGAIGLVVILILTLAVCCIKQRRAGRKEREIADAEFQKQEAELMAYRQATRGQQQFKMPAFGNQNYKQYM